MLNFWGPKKDKKVINSSTKCLISVKIAIMTPHIIPLPLVNVWLIFDLQKYVNWLCVFSKVNLFFQKAQVFCMDLQPAADPYNVVCSAAPALIAFKLILRDLFSLAVKLVNFCGQKKIYKKVINSSTKCLISVKIAILIKPRLLVNVWMIICRKM